MLNFKLQIKNIQHIKDFTFEVDLSKNKLMAVVGKNGVGKTLLFKSIQNLITSNTFSKTSNKHIFNQDSQIVYTIDFYKSYIFIYNNSVETLDLKENIDDETIRNINVELPIPFGERFQFIRFGDIDSSLRANIVTQKYNKPEQLIELLNFIYDTDRFNNLIEVEISKKKFYAIVLEDNYYIREDYLSSGEYFVINIYKLIQSRCKLIAIDEIDISLDAMAQVRFIKKLREIIQEYEINLIFSTHSLGIMKMLQSDELFYMDFNNGDCTFENKSYNYIKSLLYGFTDYDKYLLVEDDVLKDFIDFILDGEKIFHKYIILPIGGADNVIKLMEKNKSKEVFGKAENVISVLDGDMSLKTAYKTRIDISFLPFETVEKEFFEYFNKNEFGAFSIEQLKSYNFQGNLSDKKADKKIYEMFIKNKIKSQREIFEFLKSKKESEINNFKERILVFLNH